VTLITDSMIGHVMKKNNIDKVIVGADRVLSTGHVFNKIGTLTMAIVADHYGIPFYVAAPQSSFDFTSPLNTVKIEERDPNEVRMIDGCSIAPKNVSVCNPAFDMTKPELIDAIITEKGVIRKPFAKSIKKILGRS
jgi:eIF-2B alpha/beta/delta-like uncharacterized protein